MKIKITEEVKRWGLKSQNCLIYVEKEGEVYRIATFLGKDEFIFRKYRTPEDLENAKEVCFLLQEAVKLIEQKMVKI